MSGVHETKPGCGGSRTVLEQTEERNSYQSIFYSPLSGFERLGLVLCVCLSENQGKVTASVQICKNFILPSIFMDDLQASQRQFKS